jgi:hypothetical protein
MNMRILEQLKKFTNWADDFFITAYHILVFLRNRDGGLDKSGREDITYCDSITEKYPYSYTFHFPGGEEYISRDFRTFEELDAFMRSEVPELGEYKITPL